MTYLLDIIIVDICGHVALNTANQYGHIRVTLPVLYGLGGNNSTESSPTSGCRLGKIEGERVRFLGK